LKLQRVKFNAQNFKLIEYPNYGSLSNQPKCDVKIHLKIIENLKVPKNLKLNAQIMKPSYKCDRSNLKFKSYYVAIEEGKESQHNC
jgi:hypothetical protein